MQAINKFRRFSTWVCVLLAISAAAATAAEVIVDSGTTLEISGESSTTEFADMSLTVSGELTCESGAVEFSGSSAQSISMDVGSSFYNVTISNTASVTIRAGTKTFISNILTVAAGGTLIVDSDARLCLTKVREVGHTCAGTFQLNHGTASGGPTMLRIAGEGSLKCTGTFKTHTPSGITPNMQGMYLASSVERSRSTSLSYVCITKYGSDTQARKGWGLVLEPSDAHLISMTFVLFQWVRGTDRQVPDSAAYPVIFATAAAAQLEVSSLRFRKLVDNINNAAPPYSRANKFLVLKKRRLLGTNSGYDQPGGEFVDILPSTLDRIEFIKTSGVSCQHSCSKLATGENLTFTMLSGSLGGDYDMLDGVLGDAGTTLATCTEGGDNVWPESEGCDDMGGGGGTAVKMVDFSAVGGTRSNFVLFETIFELRNIGFNITRSLTQTGPFVQLNSTLIPGGGDMHGGRKYMFEDKLAKTGVTYYYMIVDVEYNGTTRWVGPVKATAGLTGATDPDYDPNVLDASGSTEPEVASTYLPPDSRTDAPTPTSDRPTTASGRVQTSGPVFGTDLDVAGITVVVNEVGRLVIQIIPPKFLRQKVKIGTESYDVIRMGAYGMVSRAGLPQVPSKGIKVRLGNGASNFRWRRLTGDKVDLKGYNVLAVPIDKAFDSLDGIQGGSAAGPPLQAGPKGLMSPTEVTDMRKKLFSEIRKSRANMRAMAVAMMGRVTTIGNSVQGGEETVVPSAQVIRKMRRKMRKVYKHHGQSFLPLEIVLGGPQQAGSDNLLPVRIHPVQFNPRKKILRAFRQLLIEIRYDVSGDPAPGSEQTDLERRMAQQWQISGAPGAAKISVSKDGIYRVPISQLDSVGFDTSADPNTFQLFHRGREVPIRVTGQFIEFVGFRNLTRHSVTGESLYSANSVYWLVSGRTAGKRAQSYDATPTGASTVAMHEAEGLFNRQRLHATGMTTIQAGHDYWFAGGLSAQGRAKDKSVPTPGVDGGGDAQIEIRLLGRTSFSSVNPDHHIRLLIDGQIISDYTFDGYQLHTHTARFSAALLTEGSTTITVQAIDDTGAQYDNYYIDYIRIRYPRTFAAVGDQLAFTTQGGEFQVSCLSGPAVGYLLRDNRVIQALDNIDNTGRFFCSGSGVVHVASGAGIMAPDSVTLDQHNRYHSKSHGADYIVVTHPNFSSAIDPLVNFRAAKGMRTFKADINEVYDSFSFGEFDPAAIKEFLRRAYHKWSGNPLRYVLLVGDATWDYRDYRGKGGMFVPTHFEPTVFYRTASDNWFASVAGEDELPDLRIGRLPVRTEAQTTTWVNKIVTYETNPSAVQKKVVFVSDNADSTFDFPDASDQHAKLVPSQYQTQKIYLGPLTSSEVRTQTINSFNEGVFLIQYNGHGAIQQWADERLLYSTDWSATSNTGHLPFVLVTNCLSGHFVSPWYDSIAETFTQSGDVGAIGFFASTGINTPYAQHLLATEIWQLLWKGENEVGLLLTAAKNRIGSGHGHLDVIRSYTLIGDPATKLAYPR